MFKHLNKQTHKKTIALSSDVVGLLLPRTRAWTALIMLSCGYSLVYE